ncbi:MAG TPA: RES family NAD+ phosphorylase [Gaiellaceae bacterium]|nr:RES family NAD+ phosphorylase [Gaiellaceae bacterium]
MARFRPIRYDGSAVPTLYAAESVDAAFSETVFHEIAPEQASDRFVPSALYTDRVRVELESARLLRLCELRGAGLHAIGAPAAVARCGPDEYLSLTVPWAQAIYEGSDVDGLIWTSRLDDPRWAIMLFGDRVVERDLSVTVPAIPLDREAGLDDLTNAATARRIVLGLSTP